MARSAAERNYEMWHQKQVDSILDRWYTWPKQVYADGVALDISYKSGKWEKRKKFSYDHMFGSFGSYPLVYTLKGEGSSRGVKGILGQDHNVDEMDLPVLAEVETLLVQKSDGSEKRTNFDSYRPILACSNDRKSLIIFKRNDLVIITGGKMYVDSRGIVH